MIKEKNTLGVALIPTFLSHILISLWFEATPKRLFFFLNTESLKSF